MKWTLFGVAMVSLGGVGLVWPDRSGRPEHYRAPSAAEVQRRDDSLRRAHVMLPTRFDAGAIDFSRDRNAGAIDPNLTSCRFLPTEPTATTPKFDCELPSGEKVKVKYGWTSEIPAELAATRLLDALGFPADRMSRVKTLRCFGCVIAPFHMRLAMKRLRLLKAFDDHLDYSRPVDFEDVAVERKLDGKSVDAGDDKGWGFFELGRVDQRRGGATTAELDALRLIAVLLSHWDNKAANQRLICAGEDTEDCAHPLAMIQDTGSDFGPSKMNLEKWAEMPVWADESTCTLSMKSMPYGGGTFADVRISEEGRRLLGDRLTQLSEAQITTLFSAAGFKDVPEWVAAFEAKVRQVSARGACPSRVSAS